MKTLGKGSVSSFLTVLLNIAWYGVALLLALMVCLAAVSPFLDVGKLTLTIPAAFSLDARPYRVTAPSLGIEDAQLRGDTSGFGFEVVEETPLSGPRNSQLQVSGSLRFSTPKVFFVGTTVVLIGLLVLALLVLGQIRALFRTLRDGQPFVPANAARLRWIAAAVIGGELARSAVIFFEHYYVKTHFSADGLQFNAWPDIDVFAIVHGVIILVIAEVFRTGTRLEEDQAGTV